MTTPIHCAACRQPVNACKCVEWFGTLPGASLDVAYERQFPRSLRLPLDQRARDITRTKPDA